MDDGAELDFVDETVELEEECDEIVEMEVGVCEEVGEEIGEEVGEVTGTVEVAGGAGPATSP